MPAELQSKRKLLSSEKMLSPLFRSALIFGICVHLVGFLVFRVISTPLPTRKETPAFVQYVSPETLQLGAALDEQAALFDSAPLFVPGEWNAAHNLQPPSLERALLRFPAYEPEISFSSGLLPDRLPFGQNYGVAAPIDLLAWRYWDLFRGFASPTTGPVELEATGVFAEVRTLSGEVIRSQPVEIDFLSMQAVQPATYYLRVEAGGRAVGRPTLSASSGDAAFDAAAYNWLTESGFSAGLPAGFLEISVYP
jgi:hypothetical protein